MVLLKQLRHDNILPFYGVSTTEYDFCLVFPWYENGNIMDYLKKMLGADKFDLASAFRQILHSRRLLAPTNSYQGRPADCAFCMKIAWFTVP